MESFSKLSKSMILWFCGCSKLISESWVDAELCLLPTAPAVLSVTGDLRENLEPFSVLCVHPEQHRRAPVPDRGNLEGVKAALPGWSSWGFAMAG